jgi:hypothetical protein
MKRILALIAILQPSLSVAQELTPRAYWPAPTGTQVLSIGAVHTSGDIIPDPSLPISGLDSEITSLHVGYLRTLDLFGRSSNLIVNLPYATGDTIVDSDIVGRVVRDYRGVGDLGVTLSVNLMGAPALTPETFAALRRDPPPIIGASLKVVAPTGNYDEDRVINVGANRWAAKLEVGSIFVLHPKWLLELEAGAWFFGDNDEFLGSLTREQNPIYSAEVHLVHRFRPGFWASLDFNGYKGGRSRVDGRRLNDLQRDSKAGFTLVFPFATKQAIKASYTYGSVNDSAESFDVFSLSYQRVL